MLAFLKANVYNIIVIAIVLLVVFLIIRKIVKDKTKAGMKVVRKHPEAFSLMGGAGALYAGTKLLSDDNLADLKQIIQ